MPARRSAISLSPAQIRRTPPAGPSPNATAKFAKYRYSTIFWPPPNRLPPSFRVFLSSSMSVAQIIAPATFWTPNPSGITPPWRSS